jgi:uridine kinase
MSHAGVLQVNEDNFDDPNLLDFELLLKNLTDIQSGSSTQTPVYSFQFSKRTGFVTTPVPQNKVLIVEGTYALKEILRPVYDLAISVTGVPYCRPLDFWGVPRCVACDEARVFLHVFQHL